MFENPRRGRQARNFTTNVSKILDLKSSSEQILFRKLSLGAPKVKIRGHNRPFYRYGGHIELIRFKEYYRMLRGHEHISFVFSSAFWDIFS